jgi:Tfp pilus assembly protein PilV
MSRTASGLTLVEILVATALSSFLIATATAGFMQMRTLARRVDAQQQLHNTARIIFERLNDETSSLMQGSLVGACGTAGAVELVYLRGKLDNTDFTMSGSFGASLKSRTDQLWSRLSWDGTTHMLSLAASSPERTFTVNRDWTGVGAWPYNNRPFYNLPTPQRSVLGGAISSYATAKAAIETTLNANALGSGSTDDIGDYKDLENNARPMSSWCTDIGFEFVCEDGSTHAVNAAADSWYVAAGQFVDGRTGSQLDLRPRLLRLRLQLTEPTTGLSEEFAFSFLLPGLSPP